MSGNAGITTRHRELKYTPAEMDSIVENYMAHCTNTGEIPTDVGLAVFGGMSSNTLRRYVANYPEFAESFAKFYTFYHHKVLQRGFDYKAETTSNHNINITVDNQNIKEVEEIKHKLEQAETLECIDVTDFEEI